MYSGLRQPCKLRWSTTEMCACQISFSANDFQTRRHAHVLVCDSNFAQTAILGSLLLPHARGKVVRLSVARKSPDLKISMVCKYDQTVFLNAKHMLQILRLRWPRPLATPSNTDIPLRNVMQ